MQARPEFWTAAEVAVAKDLIAEGWFITETCKIENGGAPKAIGLIKSRIDRTFTQQGGGHSMG